MGGKRRTRRDTRTGRRIAGRAMTGWILAAFIAAQSADVGTTIYRLRQGCVESVWGTQNGAAIAAGKGGAVVVALTTLRPTWRNVVAGIGLASGAYGTINNLRANCR